MTLSHPIIDYLDGKKLLLLGFGREGRSSYNYIRKHSPDMPLTVADARAVELDDEFTQVITGDGYLDRINEFDLILKSPGISFRDVSVDASVEVTCQTDLFMRFAPCMKIGVTGTKGKTTTSTLIYDILRAAEIPSCLIGNIGIPVLDRLDSVDGLTAVIEMSSHQLEYTRMSPHIAVFTNLYEEHLDHYNGFSGYASAKLNIMKYQNENDFFIYNSDQDYSEIFSVASVRSHKLPVSAADSENDPFFRQLATLNDRLTGVHNHQNIVFAATAARCMGIDDDTIVKGIRSFGGIEHRMEPLGRYCGISFINDCIATIPRAVMCAVEAVGDVDTLILGGMDRGLDYGDFCRDIAASDIENIIGLPETGHMICNRLSELGTGKRLFRACDMEDAVNRAYKVTRSGKSCLLSPAAASYNYYRDFEEKGRHFKSLVRSLAEKYAASADSE